MIFYETGLEIWFIILELLFMLKYIEFLGITDNIFLLNSLLDVIGKSAILIKYLFIFYCLFFILLHFF